MPEPSAQNRFLVQVAAAALLLVMAVLMFSSSWNDSVTYDETSHLAGAYGCLRKLDYRLGPQEPPLMKDLGAFPLLFMGLNEPWDDPAWENNDSGGFGRKLIFNSGNDADAMLRAARVPIMLFTLGFGWLLFWWTRKHFGSVAALLALFFFCFSPTFLAHGRIVATDVGAAAGFFVGTIGFLRFLENPSRRNTVLAGLAMAFAFLTKYSTFLLVPITFVLAAAWVFAATEPGDRRGRFLRYCKLTAGIYLIALVAMYPIYLHHTWHYAPERQQAVLEYILTEFGLPNFPSAPLAWASHNPLVRPVAEIGLGVIATYVGSAFAGKRFFFGEIYSTGLPAYFPFVYLVKEPLALHLLSLLVLLCALAGVRRILSWRGWMRAHFIEVAFIFIIACYWGMALRANLNIGVRHLLPTFPFIYVLVASVVAGFHRQLQQPPAAEDAKQLHKVPAFYPPRLWGFRLLLGALLAWQALSVVRVHPSYLAYFNELAGGPDGGWRYVVDSNVDWGQDLKRLSEFVEERGIATIQLDYFGTADPAYYLGEKFRGLSGCSKPQSGWIAISATTYQQSRETPACDYRRRLSLDRLRTTIGYSIFVFQNE